MGTEYYIIKPSTKQKFYLGRRIHILQGLSQTKEPRYADWEYWEDVVFDLQENSRYFLEGRTDITIGQIWDFCYKIYEFCNVPVYQDNDCSDNAIEWADFEEIDVLSDLLSTQEKWCQLINLIPIDYWVMKDKIVDEFETVKNYLVKGGKNDQG